MSYMSNRGFYQRTIPETQEIKIYKRRLKMSSISDKLSKRTLQQILSNLANPRLIAAFLIYMEEEGFANSDYSNLYKADDYNYRVNRITGSKHTLKVEIPWTTRRSR